MYDGTMPSQVSATGHVVGGLGGKQGEPALKTLQRVFFRAMEEILGQEELGVVLKHADTGPTLPSDLFDGTPRGGLTGAHAKAPRIARLLRSLEAVYGQRAGRGLAVRIGAACFRYGARQHCLLGDVPQLGSRLLPMRTRIHTSLRSITEALNLYADQHILLDDEERRLIMRVEGCPLCSRGESDQPVCYLAVGALQEALYWLSGGRTFWVDETACLTRGDAACMFVIDETPIS